MKREKFRAAIASYLFPRYDGATEGDLAIAKIGSRKSATKDHSTQSFFACVKK